MNRVTIQWTGPKWLKRFDPKREMKFFWRAKSIYIGDTKTTDQMLQSLTQLRYLSGITVGGFTKFSDETIRHLGSEVKLTIENMSMYPKSSILLGC